MTKADLRSHFQAKRRALSAAEAVDYSRQIAARFWKEIFIHSRVSSPAQGSDDPLHIHTFLPIARQNEVDTWPIIGQFRADFPTVRIVTSVADPARKNLTHYYLTPDTRLTENAWGVPEPDPLTAEPCPMTNIDLVLVPLLAVDERGHRVGYGGGYYDRFLADCRPDCPKIGLSFFGPIVDISDVESTDVKLDACVTPEQVYQFANGY